MLRLHFKLEFWIRFFSELNKERVVIILFREDFYSWSYKPSFKRAGLGTSPLIMGWATRNPQRQKERIEIRKTLKLGVTLFIPTIGSLPHWRTNCKQFGSMTSSETQWQLVGSIKCSWWKFSVRFRRAPGHLLLPNQFQRRLNCLLLTGQKKSAKRSCRVTLVFSYTT